MSMLEAKSRFDSSIWPCTGGLLAVPGMEAGAVAAGLKKSGNLDVAVIRAPYPMHAAGMFTTNALAAAPVTLCRHQLARAPAVRSIVINAGNANAMTGAQGEAVAEAMQSLVEEHLGGPGLVFSTGVIGVPMPLQQVLDGIAGASARCRRDGGDELADAILTTDTVRKIAAVRVAPYGPDGPSYTVGGVAKGSGMIHPRMGTMLAVVATDAPLDTEQTGLALRHAVERSLHRISVDGDTSTNDSIVLLARPRLDSDPPATPEGVTAVTEAITTVCRELAAAIVRDGEGVSRVAHIKVDGARNRDDAIAMAQKIATSSLVKTALAGGDPNWGRILSAAANAGVELRMEEIALVLSGIPVFDGSPLPVDRDKVNRAFAADEVLIQLTVGDGGGTADMLTTDLTKRYVEINSEYTT